MRGPGRRPARVGIALAGLVLAVAGCSHVLPLGPAPAATPVPRHLASAIDLQPVLSQPPPPAGGCPAGYATLSRPGTEVPDACYRKLGKPVTFTSAGVTLYLQPAGSEPVRHPAEYGVLITLPAAEAAALTAITTKVAGTHGPFAIIIAGKTWAAPLTLQPLTNGQFEIPVQSQNQALQLQRILLQPA